MTNAGARQPSLNTRILSGVHQMVCARFVLCIAGNNRVSNPIF
ncbi:hypothetical protein [Spirosoma aerophilum]